VGVASRLRMAALGLLLSASLAGCVSVPIAGPLLSSSVTQGPGGQGQHYVQLVPKSPVNGWSPNEIVQGFLLASASFGYRQIAREYLTPTAKWNPTWSAYVYSKGPTPNQPVYPAKGPKNTADVTISGNVQASLSQYGGYAVPHPSKPQQAPPPFKLEKIAGQWRISQAPEELLLTSDLFNYDYQLRNLYFFDPTGSYLVPDPVYVPLQATPVDLMTGLVKDLIRPPGDWISPGATMTAFPPGTSLTDVTLNGGTATVSLGVSVGKGSPNKKSATLLKEAPEVSAQLLWTLIGSGQGGTAVDSVELSVNGTPWAPLSSQQNPVQHKSQSRWGPPDGSSDKFYYLDDGNLVVRNLAQGTTTTVARLGKGYYSRNSQIAVSPGPQGSQYAAVLSGGTLYAGPLGGKLAKEPGNGYVGMSWDPNGNLWATTGTAIVMLPGGDSPGQPLGQPVPVEVVNSDETINLGPFTALRVAPDGVRVAIIVDGSTLNFGAIVSPPASTRASQQLYKIELSPFDINLTGTAMFSAVTWYGPDNVITLSQPGAQLTEYPVNGGTSTPIPSQPTMRSITASWDSPLVAGLYKGGLTAMAGTSLTGPWPPVPTVKNAISPVYPG
jgi:Lipoprotein LpqB beta-propeller domain/Sporulation and spore germination